MRFSDKIALVTGGTSGIGLEAARLLADQGATVIIVARNSEQLEAAQKELRGKVTGLQADVGKLSEVKEAFAAIQAKHGRIDVLVANAGMGIAAPLEAITEDQIDTQLDVNFKGVIFAIQSAVPMMGRNGSIVVTTSFLNQVGTPGLSVLSATKAAVRSLVRSFGAELAQHGIRVNAVSPGPTATPFHGKLGLSEGQLAEAASAIKGQIPLGRFGDPGEIAKGVVFLASDDASFVTGSELVADGGISQM
ncbi:SDR family oxidoreductase [Bradyrhizobium centrosematis]|uniref:SDR family oxidoreductase n=1 Tax=Bradyrhizobium centrosematis TaxID=1300039 RepID=UPI0021673DED|nr:SDR family oxidoreductase [Bradyrhizobium centrosematis]MCS3763121.1 NAD(P)-dependent dehydrogenase (short-subunit alcohol dehydrogenase family) [Bradyrhizobium centrosematis]MCS3775788.1 NAD(P)-dependent dehydrogenase (short-subunit alcohol dehydrogenase family) [Bradyrhizobium centrosematis]